jgi:hypothetical protein
MTSAAFAPRSADRSLTPFLVALVALASSGCYAGYRGRVGTTVQVQAQYGFVYQAPPPPMQTYAPPAPYAGAQWIEGHWEWNGAQYVWVEGSWVQGQPGLVYLQPRWERRGGGYVYVDGGWSGGAGVVVQPGPSVTGTVVVQPQRGPVVVQPQPAPVVVRPAPAGAVVVSPGRAAGVVVAPQPAPGRVVVQPAPPGGVAVTPGARVVVRPR